MIDERYINNWFTYHPPVADQATLYEAIRSHGREFAHIINNLVPDGQDKLDALHALRQAVMWANAAIATSPADASVDQDIVDTIHKAAKEAPAPVRTGSRYQTSAWPAPRAGLPTVPKHSSPPSLSDLVNDFARDKTGSPL